MFSNLKSAFQKVVSKETNEYENNDEDIQAIIILLSESEVPKSSPYDKPGLSSNSSLTDDIGALICMKWLSSKQTCALSLRLAGLLYCP